MARVTRRQVQGRTIAFQDFRDLRSLEDAEAAFAESREVVGSFAPGSALVLTDFTGSRFSPQMIEATKQLARDNGPHIRASALVGLSAIQRVLFSGVNRDAERHLQWFDTVPEAERWLLEQAAQSRPE